MKVNGYAAIEPKAKLTPYSYDLGVIGSEEVDIKVSYCGICHSDLSMINNDWGMTQYPIVPGHEIIGEVIATGNAVKNVKVGDKVGLGWQSFSSNPNKKKDILNMGASQVINSTVPEELESITGKLNFILNTTNVTLDWNSYLTALAPKGKFHTVGAVLEPMAIPAFSLIMGEKTVGGSPIGSPALTKTMLDFCVRHNIYPTVEEFPMAQVNEAIEHLENGKARFRIVLKNK